MQSKNNILKELSEDYDVKSNIFIEKYKNKSIEEEFSKFNTEFLDKASFIVCIFVMIYLGITIGYIPNNFPNNIYFIYIAIFALIVDIILVYLYFKASFAFDTKFKIKLAKFILNMMYFFWYCLMYIFYVSVDKRYYMLNNFVMQAFLLLFSYLFLIRSSSRFLCLSVFALYFSIYILATFSTFTIIVRFIGGGEMGVMQECNNLINYDSFIKNSEGYFNSTYITYMQEYHKEVVANVTEDYYANKHVYDSMGYNLTFLLSQYPFDFYSYAEIYVNMTKENPESRFSCYNYYNTDFVHYIFTNFPVVNYDIVFSQNRFRYVTEIIACIFGASLFYLSNFFNQYRRVVFLKGKETEKLMNYFNNMINNMQCQLISFAEDKVIFSNDKFNKQVNDNINSKKENRENDQPCYFKTAESNILTMKKKENIMIYENNKEEKELKQIHSKYQYEYNEINNNNNNANSKKNDINLEVLKLYTENNEINEEINNTQLEEEYNLKIVDYLKEFTIESLTTNITELLLKNKNNIEIINIDASDNNIELINKSNNLNDNELSCFVQSNEFNNLFQVYEKIVEIEKKSLRNPSNKSLFTNNNTIYDKDEEAILKKKSIFQLIGTFKYYKRNYKVFIRKFYHKRDKFIIDVMIDDVTEIKSAERMSFETKLKQKLFSKMAHEFKTPLIVIKSLISDLNDPDIEAENKKKLLAYIYYLSDYITFLINDIIYYSNNKEITTVKEEVDLFELIDFCEGVTESLLSVMPGNKSRVIVSVDMNEDKISKYSIKTDTIKLKQVMLNLISNAVKFTKFGEIKLSAFIHEDSLENPYLILSVQDSGIGIKPRDLEKINNLDDQVLNINTDYAYNSMGTGLGLGIVKRICRALKYKFNIETMYGKGTISRITIDSISKKNNSNKTIISNCNNDNNTVTSKSNLEKRINVFLKPEEKEDHIIIKGNHDNNNRKSSTSSLSLEESLIDDAICSYNNTNLKEEINNNKSKTICFKDTVLLENNFSFKNLKNTENSNNSNFYKQINTSNKQKKHLNTNSISSFNNIKSSENDNTYYLDPNFYSGLPDICFKKHYSNSNSERNKNDKEIKLTDKGCNDYFNSEDLIINSIKNKIYNSKKCSLNNKNLDNTRSNQSCNKIGNDMNDKSINCSCHKSIVIHNTVNQYVDKVSNNYNVVNKGNFIKNEEKAMKSNETVYLLKENSSFSQTVIDIPDNLTMLELKKKNDKILNEVNRISSNKIKSIYCNIIDKFNNTGQEILTSFDNNEISENKHFENSFKQMENADVIDKNTTLNLELNNSEATKKYNFENNDILVFKSKSLQRTLKSKIQVSRRNALYKYTHSFVVGNVFDNLTKNNDNNKYSNLVISTTNKLLYNKKNNKIKCKKNKFVKNRKKEDKNAYIDRLSIKQNIMQSKEISNKPENDINYKNSTSCFQGKNFNIKPSELKNNSFIYKQLKEAVKSKSFKNNTTPISIDEFTNKDDTNNKIINENKLNTFNSLIKIVNSNDSKLISNVDLNNFKSLEDFKSYLMTNNMTNNAGNNYNTSLIDSIVLKSKLNTNDAMKSKNLSNNNLNNTVNTANTINTVNVTNISNIINNKDKILIVDDTEAIRKSLKKLLLKNSKTKDDYEIIEAKDGVEILNIVITDQTEGSKIKMIITDENMEYMSGSTAVALIRQMENENKIHHIIIISLTAFSDEETQKNILSKGVDAIIPKPISLNDLNKLIDSYL